MVEVSNPQYIHVVYIITAANKTIVLLSRGEEEVREEKVRPPTTAILSSLTITTIGKALPVLILPILFHSPLLSVRTSVV